MDLSGLEARNLTHERRYVRAKRRYFSVHMVSYLAQTSAAQLRAQHGSAGILECVVCKVHVFEFAYRADGVCFVSEIKIRRLWGLRARARGFGL